MKLWVLAVCKPEPACDLLTPDLSTLIGFVSWCIVPYPRTSTALFQTGLELRTSTALFQTTDQHGPVSDSDYGPVSDYRPARPCFRLQTSTALFQTGVRPARPCFRLQTSTALLASDYRPARPCFRLALDQHGPVSDYRPARPCWPQTTDQHGPVSDWPQTTDQQLVVSRSLCFLVINHYWTVLKVPSL